MTIIENAEFARVWRLGLEDIGCLTDDERVRFFAFAGGALRFFEGARLQWRHGQLDPEHWHNVEKTAIDFAATPGFKAYWDARRHWLSPEFQEWYERLSQDSPKPLRQTALSSCQTTSNRAGTVPTALSSSIRVLATPETVWRNITNVRIDSSVPPRLFTLLGIPKPLHAELFDKPPQRRRVAYFANGKRFSQEITSWQPLESYAFTFRADRGFKVAFVLDLYRGPFRLVERRISNGRQRERHRADANQHLFRRRIDAAVLASHRDRHECLPAVSSFLNKEKL